MWFVFFMGVCRKSPCHASYALEFLSFTGVHKSGETVQVIALAIWKYLAAAFQNKPGSVQAPWERLWLVPWTESGSSSETHFHPDSKNPFSTPSVTDESQKDEAANGSDMSGQFSPFLSVSSTFQNLCRPRLDSTEHLWEWTRLFCLNPRLSLVTMLTLG